MLAYSLVRGAFSERTFQFRFTTHAERAKSLLHFVLEIGASLVQYRHNKRALRVFVVESLDFSRGVCDLKGGAMLRILGTTESSGRGHTIFF